MADSRGDRILFFSLSDLDAQTGRGTRAVSAFRTIGRHGTAPGDLKYPMGLATDGTHLFVADSHNHRVQQLRISDGRSVDSIGAQGSGHGQLDFPEGLALVRGSEHGGSNAALVSDRELAVGNSDRLYVADQFNCRICVFGVSPLRYLTSIGRYGSAPLEFNGPTGIAVHAGCLYVADQGNMRVQVLTLGGDVVRSFGCAPSASYVPNGIAVRPDGRLLVVVVVVVFNDETRSSVGLRTLHSSLLQVRLARNKLATAILLTGPCLRSPSVLSFTLPWVTLTALVYLFATHLTCVCLQVITSPSTKEHLLLSASGDICMYRDEGYGDSEPAEVADYTFDYDGSEW